MNPVEGATPEQRGEAVSRAAQVADRLVGLHLLHPNYGKTGKQSSNFSSGRTGPTSLNAYG
jgi:hypothetical protein